MIALLIFLLRLLVLPSKPQHRLEAENAALRQQLTIVCTENLNADVMMMKPAEECM
jgi:hypothetical protein